MSDPENPPFGGAALAASSLWAPAGSDWQREYLGFEPVPAAEIAVSEAVASAGSGVSQRLHGRCFAAREPLSTLLQPATLHERSLLLVVVCHAVCRVGNICFTHESKAPRLYS